MRLPQDPAGSGPQPEHESQVAQGGTDSVEAQMQKLHQLAKTMGADDGAGRSATPGAAPLKGLYLVLFIALAIIGLIIALVILV
jgi:hypothetical protein